MLYIKQGYALKNWVSVCHRTKESFDSSIDCNLQVFQNHTKQAKINVVFHCFPSLGLNESP